MAGPSRESEVLASICIWALAWNPRILGEALRVPELGERERLLMVRIQKMKRYIFRRLKNGNIFIHKECVWILADVYTDHILRLMNL